MIRLKKSLKASKQKSQLIILILAKPASFLAASLAKNNQKGVFLL